MSDFVLVHGAWHSGGIWDPVVDELERRGHRAVAPTLPIEDVDAGAACFAEVAAEAAAGLEKPIAVGHTTGAAIIPLLAEQLEVRELIFVNPLVPRIGDSIMNQSSNYDAGGEGAGGRRYDREARSFWSDRELFARQLAGGLPEAEVERAWLQLRAQSRKLVRETTAFTEWPHTPKRVLIYKDDADLSVPYMAEMTREEMGIEPALLPGPQLGFLLDPAGFVDALLGTARE